MIRCVPIDYHSSFNRHFLNACSVDISEVLIITYLWVDEYTLQGTCMYIISFNTHPSSSSVVFWKEIFPFPKLNFLFVLLTLLPSTSTETFSFLSLVLSLLNINVLGPGLLLKNTQKLPGHSPFLRRHPIFCLLLAPGFFCKYSLKSLP